MLNEILADLNVGWWEIDNDNQSIILSDYLKSLLEINTDTLPLSDFTGMIREDYRESVLRRRAWEEMNGTEKTFPFVHCKEKEEIWVRFKYLKKDKGYIQVIPNQENVSQDKASYLRLNNQLYQLNNISKILLSFLKSDKNEIIINQILTDILKQFKAGRTYIFEYDWEKGTQTCTYEVVDKNIKPEKDILYDLPVADFAWWTSQMLSRDPIILSSLDDLPEEAIEAKKLLQLQNIKSLIVIPLLSQAGVWGYIGIDVVDDYHRWSEDDCLWFSSLANFISLFIELHRLERNARLDKVQLQNLYNNMPLGYLRMQVLFDEEANPIDYTILEMNHATADLFNISTTDYVGKKGSEFKDDFWKDVDFLKQVLKANEYKADEHVESQQLINGDKYCHLVFYTVEQNQIVCLLSDITRSHAMHEELDRSEKILRNIYDNLPVGIELYDKNGQLVDMNIRDMEIFGLTRKEEVLGVSLFENPNIPEEALENLRNEKPASFRITYRFDILEDYYTSQKEDHIELYVKVNILRDSKGELINYLFINIDNTEISQAYSRIAEFESSFSIVSKYGKIGYCKFDLLTREGSGVPQWYINLGEEPNTPLNQIIGIYNYVNEADKQKLFEHIRKIKSGEINGFAEDLRILQKDNTWRWTQVNVLKNPANKDQSKLEMLCVNYDTTNLKETEKKLIEAKERAEISDRLKSAFLANMSHEIRTPLNAIIGFTELLVDTTDKEEKESYVKIVRENNEMLLQLISDILDLSKIEAGTLDFTYNNVDVKQLCEEIIQTYSMKTQDSSVQVLLEKDLPSCYLYSDKSRLMQVIGNFMNNAIKFTPKGSITLGYKSEGKDKIKFYVQDTGYGIPEEKQKEVFQRFVKLDNFVQGTGLGLSICSSIIKQVGGEIGVKSKVGEGSCFWFTHPYASDNKELTTIIEAQTNYLLQSNTITNKEKKVVLVAEDTESNFLLIKNIIKSKYTLLHAHNGLIAIDLLDRNDVDLILMDINMPEMDGLTATKEIRKRGIQTPIVAVTAYAFDGDKQKALDAGCNNYVSKPIRPVELLNVIESYLNL